MTVSIGAGTASQSHEGGDQRIDQRHVDAGLGVPVAISGTERVVIGLGNRNGLTLIVNNYHDLPDDVEVKVVSDSQESIHKHNAYAERTATMGELREELAQNVPAL